MVVIDIKTGNFFYSEIVKQYVDFDGGTGGGDNKPLQPKGLGIATSKYPKDGALIYIVFLEKMLGLQVMSLIQNAIFNYRCRLVWRE